MREDHFSTSATSMGNQSSFNLFGMVQVKKGKPNVSPGKSLKAPNKLGKNFAQNL